MSLTDVVYMRKESSSKKGDIKELMKYSGRWSRAEGERFQKKIAKNRKNAKPRFFD